MSTTKKILRVREVHLTWLKTNPPTLSITASGDVSSSGWKAGKLVKSAIAYPGGQPTDGIQDYDFVATPPTGIVLPKVTPITAKPTNWKNPPHWLKGVRVHATKKPPVEAKFGSGTPVQLYKVITPLNPQPNEPLYTILPNEAFILAIYRQVFGPDTLAKCQAWWRPSLDPSLRTREQQVRKESLMPAKIAQTEYNIKLEFAYLLELTGVVDAQLFIDTILDTTKAIRFLRYCPSDSDLAGFMRRFHKSAKDDLKYLGWTFDWAKITDNPPTRMTLVGDYFRNVFLVAVPPQA